MDPARQTIRRILTEAALDPAFIQGKATDENLFPASIDQDGMTITIQLSAPGEEKAIRRFKNQLRIRNPNIERIEVRQPDKATDGQPEEVLQYNEWRKKVLTQLRRMATEFGWNIYKDPVAGKNTDYLLMIRGSGSDREVVKVRVSEHPASRDKPDVDVEMTTQEGGLEDLRTRLKQEVRPKDQYPLL